MKVVFEKIEIFEYNNQLCYCIIFNDGVLRQKQDGTLKNNIAEIINEILKEYENT